MFNVNYAENIILIWCNQSAGFLLKNELIKTYFGHLEEFQNFLKKTLVDFQNYNLH